MQFITEPTTDLTYNDVFLIPSRSEVTSRFDVSLDSNDGTRTTTPVVASNMTAVSGRRMLETIARRGGIGILPQDLPMDLMVSFVKTIKSKHPIIESGVRVAPNSSVGEALRLLNRRSFANAVIVGDDGVVHGVVRKSECELEDRFATVETLLRPVPLTLDVTELGLDSEWGSAPYNDRIRELYETCDNAGAEQIVITENETFVGVISKDGAIRASIYKPATDESGRLVAGAAIGINGDVRGKAEQLLEAGVDALVVDTAHGHQAKMFDALELVASLSPTVPVIAGNTVSAAGTRDLINAGADIVKVGVGPGAMCTTRMMTAVGRPQFSAVLECADEARTLGKHVWADGGVKYPRDVALALAAGASQVMIGSWFAGTHESPGDMLTDESGRQYKESFGMASMRAVKNRTREDEPFKRARKAMFEEGISSSKMYLDPRRPGVEDLLDHITAGVRSSMTYAGATTLAEFQDRAIVGIQSAAGYDEGRPRSQSWSE